jgi:hypothetical protein
MSTNTYKVWSDGIIQALLSCVHTKSKNTKTGDMASIAILAEDIKPTDAIKSRQDGLYCGDCSLKHGKGCYVNPVAYNAIYNAGLGQEVQAFPTLNKPLRFGSLGDPGLIPIDKIDLWASKAPSWTGYTHAWHKIDSAYSRYFMASIDGIDHKTREQAKDLGYKTFSILTPGQTPRAGEILCPHTTHGVQCADCGLCAGQSRGGKDIAIEAHGPANKAQLWEIN